MTLLCSGVDSLTGIHPFLLVLAAAGLDRLVGDPRWCLHPVVVMGWWIRWLRQLAEHAAGDRPLALRLAGGVITLLLVGGSAGAGWLLEQAALQLCRTELPEPLGPLLLLIALASALAGRSLEQAVRDVLRALPAANPQDNTIGPPNPSDARSVHSVQTPRAVAAGADLEPARRALSWIVGRSTEDLNAAEILRAAAETASENAVDGLFAPLFWMLVGAALWSAGLTGGPGPLCLAWGFKAASTLDSMLGYRVGRLNWLGTAGARLDDLLVWLPCRLVAVSLPLVAGISSATRCVPLLQAALRDGAPDPSPNAGVSQAAYAHAAGVQLGGLNRYGDTIKAKPLLAKGCPPASRASVQRIQLLSLRLEALWLAAGLALGAGISAAQ
ncbi:cobalamin biosynthesis protein [Synechococcus sp. CB0101]|uniref:CobD/CbiB family cobalamin biosynthesis protein n=1 Tax=Synechococcus sp. CB0101 TaxID=232348 RepID=UPI00020021CA|nr:CobD/CbiB family cobalamin biosynthesis protein [Synechococcus sp. CB0101]QCH15822.1 cobalamin biosynthesis protein [Synechococcus sp. CB0101]